MGKPRSIYDTVKENTLNKGSPGRLRNWLGDNIKLEYRETVCKEKRLAKEIGSCIMPGFRITSVERGSVITPSRIITQISVYFNVTYVRSNAYVVPAAAALMVIQPKSSLTLFYMLPPGLSIFDFSLPSMYVK
jgi:hypothetical protein